MTYSAASAIDISSWDPRDFAARDFAPRSRAPMRRQAPPPARDFARQQARRRQAPSGILSDVFAGGAITTAAWLTAGALAVATAWTIATTLGGNPFADDGAATMIEAPAPAQRHDRLTAAPHLAGSSVHAKHSADQLLRAPEARGENLTAPSPADVALVAKNHLVAANNPPLPRPRPVKTAPVSAGRSAASDFAGSWRVLLDPDNARDLAFNAPQVRVTDLTAPPVVDMALLPSSPRQVAIRAPAMERETVPAMRQPGPKFGAIAPASAPPAATKEHAPAVEPRNASLPLPEIGSRTAIYDISASTVYLPSGERLEAHSGLGHKMDNPRFVTAKNTGPTPPNVYDLRLRESLFHGVRAIRLVPTDDNKMYGRDGILAHTYMLGPNGQSNGCVSFRDYSKFLTAFMRGEVDRMVVVARLPNPPPPVARGGRSGRYASNYE